MSVYFVYRSHYEGPAGKYVKRFDDPTVLDWFRNRWQGAEGYDEAANIAHEALGCDVYGFDSLFRAIREKLLPPPQTNADLKAVLENHLYVEGEVRCRPHVIQALTDDDEIELAYYFFDDHYLAKHRDRAAYLLHEGWQLPGGAGKGGFRPAVRTAALKPKGAGQGTTYLAFLAYYDSGSLTDIEGAWRIDGVRLPGLARYLARVTPGDWPFELRLLRSQLLAAPDGAKPHERAFLQAIRESPGDDAPWMIYSDWLEEHGRPPADQAVLERALRDSSRHPVGPITNRLSTSGFGRGSIEAARKELDGLVQQFGQRMLSHDPSKSLVHVEQHLAQLCLHTARWGRRDLYHQWVLFDDRWAGTHPDLANAVLRYAARWDVLS